jgi:heterodisulfide reductase subunit B
MDHIVEALGAESLDWSYKTACCGGSLALSEMDMVLGMLGKIIQEAKAVGAEAIVVACPLCHANLDMRQNLLDVDGPQIPIVYLTELMGLAYGLPPKSLGLGRHIVSTRSLVDRFQPEPA